MKILYFADTDTLFIELSDRASVRTEEINELVTVDLYTEEKLVQPV